MHVWLITVGEPLPEAGAPGRQWRTGMLARALIGRGHTVLWWVSTVDHFRKATVAVRGERRRVGPGLDLQFLAGRLYRRNVSIARHVNHQEIARDFKRIARGEHEKPDVVVSSLPTLELCDASIQFCRERDVPSVIDVRDLWPDEILARIPTPIRGLGKLALRGMTGAARRAIGGATRVVAISESYLSWARSMSGRAQLTEDRVFPIGYSPLDPLEISRSDAGKRLVSLGVKEDVKIVWFCGTFVGSIDLAAPIEAARALSEDTRFQFVFSGDGERRSDWERRAAGLGNVVFAGWCDSEEIRWLASRAIVGLAAYRGDALISLPNKIFEYMSFGLPIASSFGGEARALLEGLEAGVFYSARAPAQLVQALRWFADHPEERDRVAGNAQVAFNMRFRADRIYDAYAKYLEELAAGSRASERTCVRR